MDCPNCKTLNRPGARYCSNCGASLAIPVAVSASPAATRPIQPTSTGARQPREAAEERSSRLQSNTRPLDHQPAFDPRPKGAIFGENFLYEQLVFTDSGRHEYIVSQFGVSQNRRIRMCLNPACGAVSSPHEGEEPDRYCTDCHNELGVDIPELLLVETEIPYSESMVSLSSRQLPHSSVRAPLAAFFESAGGSLRYCVVSPRTQHLAYESETSQVLKWGLALAQGLDFLHTNGVYFEGDVNAERFGKVGEHPVWVNFSGCSLAESVSESEQARDTRSLVAQLYLWTTGKSEFEEDPNLMPAINQFYKQALFEPGLKSAAALAKAIDQVMEDAASQIVVDYRIGRRSHVGIQRTLNEDSLLVIETCQIKQSVAQTLGVFVVADGMGGHAAGEKASGAIVNVLAEKVFRELMSQPEDSVTPPDRRAWLQEAVQAANQAVFQLRQTAGTDMGSTLVMAILEGDRAYIAHAGDSRAYIINDQGIRRITTDHSLVERLIATNQINREEARSHPQRNVIYRTIGDKPKIEVDTSLHKLAVGDYLLLCSDGLSGMVEDKLMRELVLSTRDPQAACDALVSAANAAGGEDNITVILIKLVLV